MNEQELEVMAGMAEEGIRWLLRHVGEDHEREGLQDTPKRVTKAYREMTEGYRADIDKILGVTFDVGNVDEMVVVKDLDFVSVCEHHLLPFTGTASVAYIPKDRVVGLSKIGRLLDAYSRRLQVQERLTTQITTALDKYLDTQGSAALITAHHSCMGCRGVRKAGAKMVTSSLTGEFRKPEVRAEFLALVK